MLIELTENQTRQIIDATTIHRAWMRARSEAAQVRGGMVWRKMGATRYLIRTSPAGGQKSLGPESAETVEMHERFTARKDRARETLAELSTQLAETERMNKALRVGRAPDIVVKTLNALADAGIAEHFVVVGTHALYAYEVAAGVMFEAGAMATRDIDLLYDTRKRLRFLAQLSRTGAPSLIDVLRRADKTFSPLDDQLQTAQNAKGFEVDIIRRVPAEKDPHPLRMSDAEDDLWAVQIPSGAGLLAAPRFEGPVISTTGRMAWMRTVAPASFVAVKRAISKAEDRDPLKRRKDALQADLVEEAMTTHSLDRLGS